MGRKEKLQNCGDTDILVCIAFTVKGSDGDTPNFLLPSSSPSTQILTEILWTCEWITSHVQVNLKCTIMYNTFFIYLQCPQDRRHIEISTRPAHCCLHLSDWILEVAWFSLSTATARLCRVQLVFSLLLSTPHQSKDTSQSGRSTIIRILYFQKCTGVTEVWWWHNSIQFYSLSTQETYSIWKCKSFTFFKVQLFHEKTNCRHEHDNNPQEFFTEESL